MTTTATRKAFLDFFHTKNHTIVPAAPIVNKDDPTLFFINAGMNPFKGIFLGTHPPTYPRVANSQPCLRISGKHNDLEDVGKDTYHHTFFEMLGNWSFGDYGKSEAIQWAWELLTGIYGLPADRLYATVFEGNSIEGLAADKESYNLWKRYLPTNRILYGSKQDNFWEMAAVGPCGPCTEVHIDLRPEKERRVIKGDALVNKGHPQVVELWNLVFIEYNRTEGGALALLPARHVDTGMGLERLAMALQNKESTYDTDAFAPLLEWLSNRSAKRYGTNPTTDTAMRVAADHVRAISFAIADGQLPSHHKAGYIIRRLIRRAVRYGYSHLKLEEPFLHQMVPLLAKTFAGAYPTLERQATFVAQTIEQEEQLFLRTLRQGMRRIFDLFADKKADKQLDGQAAFELYDTYGFPFDLTCLIAREEGYQVDKAGFKAAMEAQRERSKQAAHQVVGDWTVLLPHTETLFVGYDHLTCESRIAQYRAIKQQGTTYYELILDKTPFYAEGGGQVGDQGVLDYGGEVIEIVDTQRLNNVVTHLTTRLPAHLEAQCVARVNSARRQAASRHHTATHLLEAVLREVLGDHVAQKGSLVRPESLRFDFTHPTQLSPQTLQTIEKRINALIREDRPVREERSVPLAEAKARGAMGLFGEKYGEKVRIITIEGSHSTVLCGGTHTRATGAVGYCKLLSCSSVGAGIRRIEAVAGTAFEEWLYQQETIIAEIGKLLPHASDLPQGVQALVEELDTLKRRAAEDRRQAFAATLASLRTSSTTLSGPTPLLAQEVSVPDPAFLRSLACTLTKESPTLVAVLAATIDKKGHVAISVGPQALGHSARTLVAQLAPAINGRGGGTDAFAMAAGDQPVGIVTLLQQAALMGKDV